MRCSTSGTIEPFSVRAQDGRWELKTSIEWCDAGRIGELQTLIDRHWRAGHVLARDEELLRWQHRRDPSTLSVLIARQGRRPVAMLGFVEFDACVHDERVRGGWMTNWLVVPEARGQRLGSALVEAALGAEYEFIGALAANSATRHILGGYGFVERGMNRWIRVFDLDALRVLLRGRDVAEHAWTAWAETPSSTSNRLLQGFVGACRNDAFVRRRYEEHPRFRYEVLREGDGFAAFRIELVRDSDLAAMRIVDFLGDDRLAAALVDAARAAGVVFADFACTSPRFGAPLETAGFQREDRLPAELPGRFQPLDFSDRPIVSCFWAAPRLAVDLGGDDDFYVTRADSDLDRPS